MAAILIVDDDPTIRTMFARALAGKADIELASNGAEALRMLGARKYALVLLDLHMPVMDGFVVLQALSSKPGVNKGTPVFVATADMSEQARVRALKLDAVFFFAKPVSIATLGMLVDTELKKAAKAADAAHERSPGSPPSPPAARKPG